MPAPTLVIGNKVYSSWSMRPWILMRALGLPFDETVIPLDEPATAAAIRAHSAAGKVPVLIDGAVTVWETLAIIEYLAEQHPERGIWPAAAPARAHARAIASEMHAGFQALRQACPFNITKRFAARDRGAGVAADVARIGAIFAEARARFGRGGPFLYGAFSGADAMYAPVVARFHTYSIALDPVASAYCEAVRALPAWRAWLDGARAERWVIGRTENDEPVLEDLRA